MKEYKQAIAAMPRIGPRAGSMPDTTATGDDSRRHAWNWFLGVTGMGFVAQAVAFWIIWVWGWIQSL